MPRRSEMRTMIEVYHKSKDDTAPALPLSELHDNCSWEHLNPIHPGLSCVEQCIPGGSTANEEQDDPMLSALMVDKWYTTSIIVKRSPSWQTGLSKWDPTCGSFWRYSGSCPAFDDNVKWLKVPHGVILVDNSTRTLSSEFGWSGCGDESSICRNSRLCLLSIYDGTSVYI